ncbi:MAG TPA: 50S ribosomal protein L4 [Thermoplasmata archaeon]|nr:50S ribosomal protein L4 [Thermoplasmata archaeon]
MPNAPAPEPATPAHDAATPHHRVHFLSVDGKQQATVRLPLAFSTPVRPDLIQRAVVAAQTHRRQAYGTSPTGGMRHSVQWSGKGKGVARTPRLMDSMRGAQSPNTVGGRAAHPPRTDRIWAKKINRKERRLAFASALAATRETRLAEARGHDVPSGLALPVIVDNPLEEIRTAGAAREFLEKLHLWADVERSRSGVHLKASGRARRRGRVRRTPRSVLVVTSSAGRARGFANLSGVDVVPVLRLATEDLAPGGVPGRLTLFSRAAVESLRSRLGEEAVAG